MDLRDLIIEYKQKSGLNNNQLADKLGVTKSAVGRWISGEVKRLQDDTTERLSALVGFDVDPILKGQNQKLVKPILGIAKAGYDLFIDENYLGEEEVTFDEFRKGDYFLQVTGDSMIGAGIVDSSLVYVQQTSTLSNGDIGVFQVGDEVTIKRCIHKEGILILEASNPQVQNRYFTPDDIDSFPVRIIGRVLYSKTLY